MLHRVTARRDPAAEWAKDLERRIRSLRSEFERQRGLANFYRRSKAGTGNCRARAGSR